MNEYITKSGFTIIKIEYHHSLCDIPVWCPDKALHRVTPQII